MRRRRLAIVALACCALVGCTPSRGVEPTPSITPANPTPAENSYARQQRLDVEAAEASYRTVHAEVERILQVGGASKASIKMKQTAGSTYLEIQTAVIQSYRDLGYRQRGTEQILWVKPEVSANTLINLSTCVDGRSAKTYDNNGKYFGAGELRAEKIVVKKTDAHWLVWSSDGKKVTAC